MTNHLIIIFLLRELFLNGTLWKFFKGRRCDARLKNRPFLTWSKVLNRGLEVVLVPADAVVVMVLPTLRPLCLGHVEADIEVPVRVNLLIVTLRQAQPVSRTQTKA